jgi:hypothetical protein
MPRSLLVAFVAAAFCTAPALLPSAFVSAVGPGLSGAAEARNTNVNRNVVRTGPYRGGRAGHSATVKSSKSRMGGGGGRSVGH